MSSSRRHMPAGEVNQPPLSISTLTTRQRRPRAGTHRDASNTVCDMRIGLIAVPGGFDSGLTALLDVFRTAERVRAMVDRTIAPFELRTIGPAPSVATAGGLTLAVDHVIGDDDALADLDVLMVPGIGVTPPASLAQALASPQVRRLRGWLASSGDELSLAAACTGTFVLADAGVLDERAATTCWWLAGEFRRLYPDVRL